MWKKQHEQSARQIMEQKKMIAHTINRLFKAFLQISKKSKLHREKRTKFLSRGLINQKCVHYHATQKSGNETIQMPCHPHQFGKMLLPDQVRLQ